MEEKIRAFMNTPKFCKLCGIVLALFMFTVGGVTLYNQLKVKAKCSEEVRAYVTDYLTSTVHRKRGRKTTVYAPVFTYVYDDQEFSESNYNYQNPRAFSEGEMVTIFIDPDEPTLIYAPGDKSQYIVSIALFGAGIFAFVFLYFLMANTIKEEQEKAENEKEETY